MTSTSGTPVKQIPAFPLISQRLMGYSWKSLGMEEYQEETTKKWLEEAYRADIQADQNVSEPETLPRSLLAGLYPEVVAFGVNGTKVAQAFQFFLQLNKHLGEGKKSFPAQKAFGRFIKEVTDPLWGFDPDSARGFFGEIHDDIEYQKIMVCGSNVTKQRMNRGMDLSNLEEIYTPSWLNPIVEHTALVFIAQNPDTGEDPKVVNFTRTFNSQWEKLRKNLAKTGYQADMPNLM